MANLDAWKIEETSFRGTPEEKIKHLLKYAILAPSTHNMQPWLFKIKKSSCVISYDPRLCLPYADAIGRDLYISLGCCIENLTIAAQHFGVFDRLVLVPNAGKYSVAEVKFKNLDKPKSKLRYQENIFLTIKKRVNSRGLFKRKEISQTIIKELARLNSFKGLKLYLFQDRKRIEKMSRLTAEGLKQAYKEPKFRQEMSGWINSNLALRNEGIPGYSLRMPFLLSLIFPTIVRNFNVGKRVGQINYISMASSTLITAIFAEKNTKENWINTGRLAERMMLYLQSNNIKTSIFVASVEIGNLYKEVQKLANTKYIPQFVFCAGYMSRAQKQTPRHPLENKLVA